MQTKKTLWNFSIGLLAGFLILGFQPPEAPACSVPVFRYALEQWAADPYGIIVFYRGALASEDTGLLDALRQKTGNKENPVNVAFQMVDLDSSLSVSAQAFWKQYGGDTLPWAVVRYPILAASQEVIWRGRPNQSAFDRLVDSPKRREIVQRILSGDSIVWVLLESGNKTLDEAAFSTLTRELARLEKLLKLPFTQGDLQDPDSIAAFGSDLASTLPLRLSFPVVRLARNDPSEQMLVTMLLKSEPDLLDAEYANQPMAFPVYGRGRVLCALVGSGINAETIEDVCVFLTGPCSCQVKASNPGTDLLMTASWDSIFSRNPLPPKPAPVLTGALPDPPAPAATSEPMALRAGLLPAGGPPASGQGSVLRNSLAALGALLVLAFIGAYALKPKG
ncbi:MAG: hypothetical protein N3D11_17215 [Candidatus Sumerlaeia bacterium]|nr:hypothetical protein [Candidatus Sumerlaeia bacterium]